MPSGRLESTIATSSETLTPPCRTVSPSTNDSGIAVEHRAEHDRERRALRLRAVGVLAVAAAGAAGASRRR